MCERRRRSDFTVRLEATGPIGPRERERETLAAEVVSSTHYTPSLLNPVFLAGEFEEVRSVLVSARHDVMAILPAISQESYVRAYPHVARLHMLQEVRGGEE